MNKLPKWFLTSGLPAFRDGESSTALEQTYKVYQAMQNLIEEYNQFVDHYNEEWSQFVAKYNGDIEVFTLAMRQEFQDFIDVVDLKLATIEETIGDGLNIDGLTQDVELLKSQMAELQTKVNEEISTQLDALETKVNSEIATQIAGAKTYTDEQISALRNEIILDLEGDY